MPRHFADGQHFNRPCHTCCLLVHCTSHRRSRKAHVCVDSDTVFGVCTLLSRDSNKVLLPRALRILGASHIDPFDHFPDLWCRTRTHSDRGNQSEAHRAWEVGPNYDVQLLHRQLGVLPESLLSHFWIWDSFLPGVNLFAWVQRWREQHCFHQYSLLIPCILDFNDWHLLCLSKSWVSEI